MIGLFGRGRKERDLDDELRAFLEMAEARHRQRGVAPGEARRLARLELGGLDQVKDNVRDAWFGATLDSFLRDLGYGLRSLRKNPVFTVVAVLTIALGIGANASIFSLVHAVLLRPLPYDDADRLALVWCRYDEAGQSRNPASGPELVDLRERSRVFDGVAGIWSSTGSLTGKGEPEQLRVGFVTSDFFDVLGAQPSRGRGFTADEEGHQGPGSILLSDGLWRRRFAGNPDVVGDTVQYDGQTMTVVGVMPPGFELRFPEGSAIPVGIQAWLPFAWKIDEMPRDLAFVRVLGRLKPEVTLAQARDDSAIVAGSLRDEYTRYNEIGLGFDVVALHDEVVREIRPALLALFCGVGLVLLIACVNVANLQLGRFGARRKEIALRAALGASRGRIVRQLLLESLVLALIGGCAGLALAGAALPTLLSLRPKGLEALTSVGLSLPVVGFTLLLSLLTGVLFGLAPIFESSRISLMTTLRKGGRGSSSHTRERFRGMLVTAEFALGFLLLVGAGLMARTLVMTVEANPGFRPSGALTFQLSLPRARYADDDARAAFTKQLTADLAGLPGVTAIGAVSHLPLDDYPNWYGFTWVDGATDQEKQSTLADQRAVTPGYFEALGAELIEGRTFEDLDRSDNRQVIIIDELLARQLWPDGSPIGRGLHLEAYENGRFIPRRTEVVGVVRHVQTHGLTTTLRGQAYLPHTQSSRPVLTYVARTTGDPESLVRPITSRLNALDADLPLAKVRRLDDYVAAASAPARFTAILAGVFAATALLLASIGIYGVLAFSVEQRRHEIGVRLAMGARSAQILRLVVGRGFRTAVAGLALGLGGALLLGRFLAGLLYGVGPTDPMTYAGVSIILLGVALVASWLPARRAARVDPANCLRCE